MATPGEFSWINWGWAFAGTLALGVLGGFGVSMVAMLTHGLAAGAAIGGCTGVIPGIVLILVARRFPRGGTREGMLAGGAIVLLLGGACGTYLGGAISF